MLGLLTRKRVRISGLNAERSLEGWTVEVGLAPDSPNPAALLEHLRKMEHVTAADLAPPAAPTLAAPIDGSSSRTATEYRT